MRQHPEHPRKTRRRFSMRMTQAKTYSTSILSNKESFSFNPRLSAMRPEQTTPHERDPARTHRRLVGEGTPRPDHCPIGHSRPGGESQPGCSKRRGTQVAGDRHWRRQPDAVNHQVGIQHARLQDVSWICGATPSTLPPNLPLDPQSVMSLRGAADGSWRGVVWKPRTGQIVSHPKPIRHEPTAVIFNTFETYKDAGKTLAPGSRFTFTPVYLGGQSVIPPVVPPRPPTPPQRRNHSQREDQRELRQPTTTSTTSTTRCRTSHPCVRGSKYPKVKQESHHYLHNNLPNPRAASPQVLALSLRQAGRVRTTLSKMTER